MSPSGLLRLVRLLAGILAAAGAPTAAADPQLQVVTTVVNLFVPAGAFDPATGRAEVTLVRGLVVQVMHQSSWKLRLRSARATLATRTFPPATKPVSDLQLHNAADGSRLGPTTSFQEIARGGNTHGWLELAFDVILRATTDDAGGLYTVNLEFDFN